MCQAFLYKPHPTKNKDKYLLKENDTSSDIETHLKGKHKSISGADQSGPTLRQAVLQQISQTL